MSRRAAALAAILVTLTLGVPRVADADMLADPTPPASADVVAPEPVIGPVGSLHRSSPSAGEVGAPSVGERPVAGGDLTASPATEQGAESTPWRITEADYQAYLQQHHSPLLTPTSASGLSARSRTRLERGRVRA